MSVDNSIAAAELVRLLRADPAMKRIGERLMDAGASKAFVRGLEVQFTRIPKEIEAALRWGTGSANRSRRTALAKKFRKLAKQAGRDPDAKVLTLLRLDDDAGPYRVTWVWSRAANRPTVSRVLEEAAEQLEIARNSVETVKWTRDVVLGVAGILDERFEIVARVTGKRLATRRPLVEIAAIASVLLDRQIAPSAVKKILDRHR